MPNSPNALGPKIRAMLIVAIAEKNLHPKLPEMLQKVPFANRCLIVESENSKLDSKERSFFL
jgi:hypothetical protein